MRDPDASVFDPDASPTSCDQLSCSEPGHCEMQSNKPICMCPVGFETDPSDARACRDVDECAAATHDCDEHADCINRSGGYDCACKEGFTGTGRVCTSNADCGGLANTCHADAVCKPAADDSAAVMCQCGEGYEGDGHVCSDIDECADGSASCNEHAHCENLRGGYRCACDALFVGNAQTEACRDACADALLDSSRCATGGHARCSFDEHGAASCTSCLSDAVGDGKVCSVDAECSARGCGANTVCTGAAGSRSCACAPGFEGDPQAGCTDIDECAKAGNELCDASKTRCLNSDGGYVCDCLPGYERVDGECVNIDECTRNLSGCDPNAVCSDKPGSYDCSCKPGFRGDGRTCADIDECMEKTADCIDDGIAACENTQGSYQCVCPKGYAGDGKTQACACDLSGYWGVRQAATVVLPERAVGNVVLIEAGTTTATLWELHRYVYDGTTIRVEKKQCGADHPGEIYSPLYSETYSSFTPNDSLDKTDFQRTVDIPLKRSDALPGKPFVTPRDALVQGLHMKDPVNDPWPAKFSDIAESDWEDSDHDGEPGITLWPGQTTHMTQNGKGTYSYLPVALMGDSTRIDTRTGCVSTAIRSITHLDGSIQSCSKLVGKLISEKTEGRVHSCSVLRMSDWDTLDVTCTKDDWSDARKCTDEQIEFLDDQDQTTNASATFESVKLGDASATDIDCATVRNALPPKPTQ